MQDACGGVATAIWQDRLAECQKVHPDLAVDPERFLAFVRSKLPSEVEFDSFIGALALPDLYLAFACASGHPAAIGTFERSLLHAVDRLLGRKRVGDAEREELEQSVRHHLLIGESGRNARISLYSGQAPLGAWLAVVTTRLFQQWKRSQKNEGDVDELDVASPTMDPELRLIKTEHKRQFEAVFAEVLAALGAEERTLLRLYFADGLTIYEIGELLAVHPSTVSRRLAAFRERILVDTCARLRTELNVSETELGQILATAKSQVDFSLSQVLSRPERTAS
jgi:RNA polymerase sigma-70 factor (ECF subfamily)